MAIALSPPQDVRLDGPGLRLLRLSRHVTAAALGRKLGVSRQRVGAIEATANPTHRSVRRYLWALAECEAER